MSASGHSSRGRCFSLRIMRVPLLGRFIGLSAGSPLALQLQHLALLEHERVVGATGTPAALANIDKRRFGPGVAEQLPDGLGVVRIFVEVGGACEVPKLVRCHVDAEIMLDRLDDLIGERLLVLELPEPCLLYTSPSPRDGL